MKKIAILAVPIVVIALILNLHSSPCDSPTLYKIGSIDPKFKLDEEAIKNDIKQAGEIWSKAYGKNLYELNPKGELTINFVYDERQILNSQINQLEDKLKSDDAKLQPQIDEFNKLVTKFKADVATLNAEIQDWNKKGGAPPEVYASLKQRQQDLQAQAAKLNEMAKTLNQSTVSYNNNINVLNSTINKFNATITQKPEEGLFNPNDNSINIYFATNKSELVHTLAHELGHAIGLEHVKEPKSIMYEFTNQILLPSKEDIDELKYTCRDLPIWQRFVEKINAKIKAINTTKN